MPRYFFVIQDEYQTHLDETGFDFVDLETACSYAKRIVRELREDGYNDPTLVVIVKDENGVVLFSLPFVEIH